MADEEAWHPGHQQRQVAQTWDLLVTAATAIGVLQAGCVVGRNSVDPTLTRQQHDTARYPQCGTALQYQTVPTAGLSIMIVIVAAARGACQDEGCVGAEGIAEVNTNPNTPEPETA